MIGMIYLFKHILLLIDYIFNIHNQTNINQYFKFFDSVQDDMRMIWL